MDAHRVYERGIDSQSGFVVVRVVSLFDRSHHALYPWRDAGFDCVAFDIAQAVTVNDGVRHIVCDISELEVIPECSFVMGWPPCTDLAASGALHWKRKGPDALARAIGLVEKVVSLSGQVPYIIENPKGRLSSLWKQPNLTVQPWWYGDDCYTKATCLWLGNGAFPPARENLEPRGTIPNAIYHMQSSVRSTIGTFTPHGLSAAIFKANGARLLCGERLDNGLTIRMEPLFR